MKYGYLVFTSAFALAGVAQAASDDTVSSNERSDYKVECIEQAIADETPDDQKAAFVEQCLQEKLAATRNARQKKG